MTSQYRVQLTDPDGNLQTFEPGTYDTISMTEQDGSSITYTVKLTNVQRGDLDWVSPVQQQLI